jgi:glycopeptide antibiotics resistance protein
MRKKKRDLVLFYLYFASVALLVMTPTSSDGGRILGIFSFDGHLEKFLNFVLLIPMPHLLCRAYKSLNPYIIFLLGPTFAGLVELLQKVIPGRQSDISDFILNSLGYLISVTFVTARKSLIETRV